VHQGSESQKGIGKQLYQGGHRVPGTVHEAKEVIPISGSLERTMRVTRFLQLRGFESQCDEMTLGDPMFFASHDFVDANSELHQRLRRLFTRNHKLKGAQLVSSVMHPHPRGGLDAHNNSVCFNFIRNVVETLFSTTPSDEMIRRYWASAVSRDLSYPNPEDHENFRLEEFIDEDADPQLKELLKPIDDEVCGLIREGKIGSFRALKVHLREAKTGDRAGNQNEERMGPGNHD